MNKLLEYQKRITELQHAINILNWDLMLSAPKDAKASMIDLIASLASQLFSLKTSEEYEIVLTECIASDEFKDLSIEEQRYIKNLLDRYQMHKKIPKSFNDQYNRIKMKANVVWEEAKKKNNYKLFKPYLEQLIENTKRYYTYIDAEHDLYDVMLNVYEKGITSKTIDRLFSELKSVLIPLIKEVGNKDAVPYLQEYSEEELKDCAEFLLDYIGFDMNRGKIGFYPHGFTEKMAPKDVRIAFRLGDDPIDFVTTVIHEGGHGIFEQNIRPELSRYCYGCIEDYYALHESQSRFYENILGRNINFWIPIYDTVKEKLNLNMSIEEFVAALNVVKPDLIRTKADELTYCLHIILRYEIERDIFQGKLTVDEIPKVWNQKMEKYLGVRVENDSDGLMQDVHWSDGDFGYFPSYLLGTIYDGMFLECVERDLGSIDTILKEGRIKEITNYLIENIYQHGGAYDSCEVLKRMGQGELTAKPIADYFTRKYTKK